MEAHLARVTLTGDCADVVHVPKVEHVACLESSKARRRSAVSPVTEGQRSQKTKGQHPERTFSFLFR